MLKLRTIPQRLGFAGDLPAGVKVIGWFGLVGGCSDFLAGLAGGVIHAAGWSGGIFPDPYGGPLGWVGPVVGGLWALASLGLLRGRRWARRAALASWALVVFRAMWLFAICLRGPPALPTWADPIFLYISLLGGLVLATAALGYLMNRRVRELFDRR
ncbi:MAG: hypothetical protein AMJ81_00750 [Phycisphaerae bacterium SM23_33]|jgi:hypothetical protein|nr:MAG: hypothetical protein AMJ81_00750 [Phycisphaerae bacterium SM23_33]